MVKHKKKSQFPVRTSRHVFLFIFIVQALRQTAPEPQQWKQSLGLFHRQQQQQSDSWMFSSVESLRRSGQSAVGRSVLQCQLQQRQQPLGDLQRHQRAVWW